MKHTLQSLLMTTVLTLPAAFAGTLDLSGNSAAVPKQEPSSVEISTHPQPTLDQLNRDVLQDIIGLAHNNGEKFYLGFTNLQALQVLAQTCSWLYELVQPMLNAIRRLTHELIRRQLQGCVPTPDDAGILTVLGIKTAAPFDNAKSAAFAVKFWTMPMRPAERRAFVADINSNTTTFTKNQKNILKGLLPNATLYDIEWAATALFHLETACPALAAILCELTANHKNVNKQAIRLAADRLLYLGTAYHERAEVLFKRLTAHAAETPEDMFFRAYGFRKLGSISPEGSAKRAQHHENAATLYEQAPNHHPTAIHKAARGLCDLGSEYPKGSAKYTEYNNRAHALYMKHILPKKP